MIEVGRICVKLAGRDAGLKCVVVDILKGNMVLIDGETRKRKCNIKHLEPLKDVVKIDKNASHEKVCAALKIKVVEKKLKKAAERPKKIRKKKEKPVEELEKKVEKTKEKIKEKKKEIEEKAEKKEGEKEEGNKY